MTTATLVEPQTGFHALSLSSSVLAALDRAAYLQPTPIQAALIPEVLAGRDVIGQAQTGTGKTAAFLLPFFRVLHLSPVPSARMSAMSDEEKANRPRVRGGERINNRRSYAVSVTLISLLGCSLVL